MKMTRSIIIHIYAVLAIIFTGYGILLLPLYGMGMLYIWPGVLYIVLTFAVWRNKLWEIPVTTMLFYVICAYLWQIQVSDYVSCVSGYTPHDCAQGVLRGHWKEWVFILFTTVVAAIRLFSHAITRKVYFQSWISPVTILCLVWTLFIGYQIWTY